MGDRVLVCGGRDFNDRPFIHRTLCDLDAVRGPFFIVIHGGASGADSAAETWAISSSRQVFPFAAEWRLHGKAAGPIRNQRMIDKGKPDLVIAFPGGRGTADMVRRARVAGVEVIEVRP